MAQASQPETCRDYLAAVKHELGLVSDYRLSLALGLSRSAVSLLQHGKTTFDDSTAVKVAELLRVDAARVLATAHAERAVDPALRAIWSRMAHASAAVLLAAAGLALAYPASSEAAPGSHHESAGVCITSNRRRRKPRARQAAANYVRPRPSRQFVTLPPRLRFA